MLYKVLVRPIALYTCDAWATTKANENKLATFESKALKTILSPKRNALGKFELRTNQKIGECMAKQSEGGPIELTTTWKPGTKRPR